MARNDALFVKWVLGIVAVLVAGGVVSTIRLSNVVARSEAGIEYVGQKITKMEQDITELTRRMNDHLQK